MKLVAEIIQKHYKRYPHFDYYESIIEEIERNRETKPDICIESCKSLIEGVSKTILKELGTNVTNRELDNQEALPLFRKAIEKLSEYNEDIDEDFIRRGYAFVQRIVEVRNKRGDISHGKIAPKAEMSSKQLSRFVSHVTSGLAYYMLENFYSIEILKDEEISYEENPDFNAALDEEYSLPISYSKALYQQDYVTYSELLKDHLLTKEEKSL